MRRIIIWSTLLLVLWAVYRLNRLASDWHYIVPAEPGQLLYVASFDGESDDWEQYPGNQATSQVIDGRLRIEIYRDDDSLYSTASPYFGNFDFEVQARPLQGSFTGENENAYGVIFRQRDRENYYVFLISGDGYYRVRRVVDSRDKELSNWAPSPSINQGIEATNVLRVVGNEDHFQFYINGDRLDLCIPNDPDAESTPLATGECRDGRWQNTLIDEAVPFGRLGVAVVSDVGHPTGIIVEFDNALIHGPQPMGSE